MPGQGDIDLPSVRPDTDIVHARSHASLVHQHDHPHVQPRRRPPVPVTPPLAPHRNPVRPKRSHLMSAICLAATFVFWLKQWALSLEWLGGAGVC